MLLLRLGFLDAWCLIFFFFITFYLQKFSVYLLWSLIKIATEIKSGKVIGHFHKPCFKMTLVIAHKKEYHFSLTSDTRISFGSQGYFDYGIKIFSVPVKIYSPQAEYTNISKLVYDNKFGLAIVGSAINAYTVKESISEILQNLVYLPGHTDISMNGIASLIFKVFNRITKDLGEIMHNNGICELIIGGFCCVENKLRVFKFSCDTSNFPITPYYEEILIEDGIEFFGSGKSEAEKVCNDGEVRNTAQIVKKVIVDGLVPSVGGGIQYGEFHNTNDFQIFGIEDYETNPDGSFKGYLYTLRGMNLYKGEFERETGGFHIGYTFKGSFQKEISKLLK